MNDLKQMYKIGFNDAMKRMTRCPGSPDPREIRHALRRIEGGQMQTVHVSRVELLKRVKGNREKHVDEFNKAVVGYRKMAIEELDKMIAEAKAGKRIQRAVNLVEPMDHTREYDVVIEMLEMSIDNDITLTTADFQRYALDQWEWSAQFTATNTTYIK